jgi:hypothetical protein
MGRCQSGQMGVVATHVFKGSNPFLPFILICNPHVTNVSRKPNWNCLGCGVGFYRRPFEFESETHIRCTKCYNGILEERTCGSCKHSFKPRSSKQVYCNRVCAGRGRRVGTYTKDKPKNAQLGKLLALRSQFNFDSCMVEGCTYNVTYDVHRHVPGKDGGKYEVGNMFAICPNHHAEVTRKITRLTKVSDCVLRTC